jgi:hypothetical protein
MPARIILSQRTAVVNHTRELQEVLAAAPVLDDGLRFQQLAPVAVLVVNGECVARARVENLI